MIFSNALQNLIEDNKGLFSLPEIVINLNTLLNDPNSTNQQISDLILQDAPLTVRLLKIVNSPYYNFSSPIDTITQAISVLGTKELSSFIISTKVINKFNYLPLQLISITEFWQHNLACAIAAKTISKTLSIPNSEQLYIAGLIHDIGKLVLYITQPTLCESLIKKMKTRGLAVNELEDKIFGYNHSDVGATLLTEWGLPELLIQTTQLHHKPEQSNDYPVEVAIIHLANGIANLIEKPLSVDDALPINHVVWEKLNINSKQFVHLTNESELKYSQVSNLLIDKQVPARSA